MDILDCGRDALFLDIDGTLLDVGPTPDAVTVPPELPLVLDRLERAMDGAMAFVTGRSLAAADRLFAPLRLAASGAHGTELRPARDASVETLAAPLDPSLPPRLLQATGLADGVMVEIKRTAAAVHYRLAPEMGPALRDRLMTVLADFPGMELRTGRMVFEVVPAKQSKGTAVEAFMRAAPFRGRRPVFIGDDIGDEAAFAVARRMGGVALTVAGEHFRSGADFAGPPHVREWLASCAEAASRLVRRIA